jgi:type I restriction enzyme R subunit
VRRQQDQIIDPWSIDVVTRSGHAPQHRPEYDAAKTLVSAFEQFVAEHRDRLDALQVLYARPYGERLTRKQIRALADAIALPPRQWTTDALWAAYERLGAAKERGASTERLWTDIVSLARHALHPEAELVPFADDVHRRFAGWMLQQENAGTRFSEEQCAWLERIRDRIAADAEVRVEDLDRVPAFVEHGGLGAAWKVFGERLEGIVAELNAELVA